MLTATMLDNGMVLLRDDVDGFEAAVSADDWNELQAFPVEDRRPELVLLLQRRRGDPTGGRTEIEQAMVDDASQGQGERHQEGERE